MKTYFYRVSFWIADKRKYVSKIIGLNIHPSHIGLYDILNTLEKTYAIKRNCFHDVEFKEV